MKNKALILIFIVFFTIFSFAQEFDVYKVKGVINSTRTDDFLTLRAQAVSEEDFFINELNYNFVVLKKGSSGNLSKNNQSNDFSLKPKEEKQLSTIKINIKKNEELKVYLFIKYKGKLINRDTLFFLPKEKK